MKDSIRAWLTDQFGNDEELFAELYDQYSSEMKSRAAKLSDLVTMCNVAELGELGHAMKGMALQIGDTETADICKCLQDAGRSGNLSACTTLVPAVSSAVAAI